MLAAWTISKHRQLQGLGQALAAVLGIGRQAEFQPSSTNWR